MAESKLKKAIQGKLLQMALRKYVKEYRQSGEYYVREIYPNVYRFLNTGVHMELFVGTERALLLDTGNGCGKLPEEVRKITTLPLTVVNSHGHLDHTCGNYQFDQEIYIHPKDMELCRLHNSREMRSYSASMAAGMKGVKGPMAGVPADFDADWFIRQGCGNLVALQENQVFDLGGITLEVVELPGHTVGSIGLLYTEKKVLYSGDAINSNVLLCHAFSAPLSVYRRTLEKAESLDFNEMIVAHWFNPIPKERLKLYRQVAEDPDFEHGIPYESPVQPKEAEVRQCIIKGKKPSDLLDPDFAAITISRDNLR